MKTYLNLIAGLVAVIVFAGCAASPPKPASNLPVAEVTADMARDGGNAGARVRWGGEIVEVRPKENETCFEVLSRPLGESGRPLNTDRNFGRFLACSKEFYDPAVYVAEREVSVVGTLAGPVDGKIGERDYRFPKVEVEDVYLWPTFTRNYYRPYRYYDPFWDPFFYPYRSGYYPFRRCYGCFW